MLSAPHTHTHAHARWCGRTSGLYPPTHPPIHPSTHPARNQHATSTQPQQQRRTTVGARTRPPESPANETRAEGPQTDPQGHEPRTMRGARSSWPPARAQCRVVTRLSSPGAGGRAAFRIAGGLVALCLPPRRTVAAPHGVAGQHHNGHTSTVITMAWTPIKRHPMHAHEPAQGFRQTLRPAATSSPVAHAATQTCS